MKYFFEQGNMIARYASEQWDIYKNNLLVAFIDEQGSEVRFIDSLTSFSSNDLDSLNKLTVTIARQQWAKENFML